MEENHDDLASARELAWKHFDLHATHRMEMFRSYVTFIAIAYAGYGWSLQAKAYLAGVVFGILAIILSASFYLFDQRIRQLLKISERYLMDDEKQLSRSLSNPNIRLFRKADLITRVNKRSYNFSYSRLFRIIYAANILLAGVFFILLVILASTSK
jgi:hypothetical protein